MTDLIDKFRDYQIEWLTSHNDINLQDTEPWVIQFLEDTADAFKREELSSISQTFKPVAEIKVDTDEIVKRVINEIKAWDSLIPLDEIKENSYNQGFYDGYKKATKQANDVIDDIKTEINAMYDSNEYSDEFEHGIMAVKELINKHISGKENE